MLFSNSNLWFNLLLHEWKAISLELDALACIPSKITYIFTTAYAT